MSFGGRWNWLEMDKMHNFQMHIFPPKIQINSSEKCTFFGMSFNEM
jgi:hypothetical protein